VHWRGSGILAVANLYYARDAGATSAYGFSFGLTQPRFGNC